ncbi:MAG: TIM barrel protein [Fimbriimonadaceae bacterium]|nr:TIM barrel protein [Fimbriimonadaceae bacterium]
MQVSRPRRLSLSTWAVHSWLGVHAPDSPGQAGPESADVASFRALAEHLQPLGIETLEVCHFHLPRAQVTEIAAGLRADGFQTYQLLIDDGDLAHPTDSARDAAWMTGWLERAAEAGFARVRVIAGKTPDPERLPQVVTHLDALCARATELGVRVVFENWYPLMATPDAVLHIAREFGDRIGLCFDFGNWGGPTKYADLGQIVHLAESCHAKCQFQDGQPDEADFGRCLELTREVGFDGPYTLVHGEAHRPGEPTLWESIRAQADLVRPYL